MRLLFLLPYFVACYAFADPCHLILVRHGETEALAKSVYHEDSELNDKGRQQAKEVVERLRGVFIDAIYSSPLRRAVSTAKPLSSDRNLSITTYDELRERGHGSLEGHPITDLEGSDLFVRYYHPASQQDLKIRLVPDAENYEESTDRFLLCLKKISANHPGQTVVIVSHFALMKGLTISLTHNFDQNPIPNGSLLHVTGDGENLSLANLDH
jgi:broad specificity phosphatase PhoE